MDVRTTLPVSHLCSRFLQLRQFGGERLLSLKLWHLHPLLMGLSLSDYHFHCDENYTWQATSICRLLGDRDSALFTLYGLCVVHVRIHLKFMPPDEFHLNFWYCNFFQSSFSWLNRQGGTWEWGIALRINRKKTKFLTKFSNKRLYFLPILNRHFR